MELETRAGNEDSENTGKINRLVVRDGGGRFVLTDCWSQVTRAST